MEQSDIAQAFIATGILLVVTVLARSLSIRTLRGLNFASTEAKRKWIVLAKNTWILIGIFGLVVIWGAELKTFAVSLVAIAAALVIATKEMLLCLMGGLLKAGSRSFSIGDRIEVKGIRGDVIDHNLLVTTLYEIGPGKETHQFTGRVLVLPNSVFLSDPVVNETETGAYTLHIIRIPFKRAEDWKGARRKLLDIANKISAPYIEDAKTQFGKLGRMEGLEAPNVDPRISLVYPDDERIDLLLRLAVPTRRKGRIEQAVLARFEGLAEGNGTT